MFRRFALFHEADETVNTQQESFVASAIYQLNAGIAQLVEQLICNQQVVGSNPTAGLFCACAKRVHRHG